MSSIRIGQRGEEIAARFLLSEGFDLLHRNWRSGRYELDIVARKEGVLHIVEVKSRKADGLTAPEEAMTRKKFNALFRAAQQYVALYRIDADTQFDLIAVDLLPDSTHRLRYIPNALVTADLPKPLGGMKKK